MKVESAPSYVTRQTLRGRHYEMYLYDDDFECVLLFSGGNVLCVRAIPSWPRVEMYNDELECIAYLGYGMQLITDLVDNIDRVTNNAVMLDEGAIAIQIEFSTRAGEVDLDSRQFWMPMTGTLGTRSRYITICEHDRVYKLPLTLVELFSLPNRHIHEFVLTMCTSTNSLRVWLLPELIVEIVLMCCHNYHLLDYAKYCARAYD